MRGGYHSYTCDEGIHLIFSKPGGFQGAHFIFGGGNQQNFHGAKIGHTFPILCIENVSL